MMVGVASPCLMFPEYLVSFYRSGECTIYLVSLEISVHYIYIYYIYIYFINYIHIYI